MVDLVTMSQSHGTRSDRSTIKAQFFTLDTTAEGRTSDEMEATHQRAHDQRIRLEAANCDSMRYAFQ